MKFANDDPGSTHERSNRVSLQAVPSLKSSKVPTEGDDVCNPAQQLFHLKWRERLQWYSGLLNDFVEVSSSMLTSATMSPSTLP